MNALAKGSRLLPAPFQDAPEDAGDKSAELSVLILLPFIDFIEELHCLRSQLAIIALEYL